MTGALKDYLDDASKCFENAELVFEPVAYPCAADLIQALENGEVDCMFPSNLSTSDVEALNIVLTPSIISSEIYAVVRKPNQNTFLQQAVNHAAVIEGDPNYKAVMMDHFPNWKWDGYPDTQSCLKAVADKEADCFLISNYYYNKLARQLEKHEDAYVVISSADGIIFLPKTENEIIGFNLMIAFFYFFFGSNDSMLRNNN